MKSSYVLLLLVLLLTLSCSKDNDDAVYGTVQLKMQGTTNTWLVAIDNIDPAKQAFICDTAVFTRTGGLYYHCGNSIQVTNLPAALAVPRKKIRFSKWKDMNTAATNPLQFNAHLIEVYNAIPVF